MQPGGQPNMQQIMKQAQLMQQQVAQAQAELAAAEVTGTAGVTADPALLRLGHVEAGRTEANLLLDLAQGRGEPVDVGRVGGEDVEGDALGALRADAREPAQLIDQVLDGALVHVIKTPAG